LVLKRAIGVIPNATSSERDHLPASKVSAKAESLDNSSKNDACCGENWILDRIWLNRATYGDVSEEWPATAKDSYPVIQ
jgi:hypothetical protein